MRYEIDARGGIVPDSLRMTPEEIAKRGWLNRPINTIPHWAQAEVRRHREARAEAWHREEMERRYGQNYRELQHRNGLSGPAVKREMLARLEAQQKKSV